jgi:hypothetical protein
LKELNISRPIFFRQPRQFTFALSFAHGKFNFDLVKSGKKIKRANRGAGEKLFFSDSERSNADCVLKLPRRHAV